MTQLVVEIQDDPTALSVVVVHGRDAWALGELLRAGENGCTPIEHPGPRWSGYVHKLRKAGIDVETRYERHGGPFAGKHARYILRSRVQIVGAANDNVVPSHG